jgi:hypothetical protein
MISMHALLILAVLGQVRYADEFAAPSAVRLSSEVAEPFSPRVLPEVLRPAPPAPVVVPVPAPLPDLPEHVFAPTPPPRRIRFASDQPVKADPEPGVRRPDDAVVLRLMPILQEIRDAIADLARKHETVKAAQPAVCDCPCTDPLCTCHPQGERVGVRATTPPVVKTWRGLTGEPGVEGYGALNSLGQVVVEQRRFKALPVATYQAPAVQPVYQSPPAYGTFYGAPFTGSTCAPGTSCAAQRGFFGGIFGR